MVPSADDGGYFMVASDGGVFAFGDAKFEGSCPGIGGCSGPAVAVVPDASGNGYWLVTATGHVYTFGDASYYGAPGQQSTPVTSAVRTADGKGYWILFANGTVDAYGDATNMGAPVGQTGGFNRLPQYSQRQMAGAIGSPPLRVPSTTTGMLRTTGAWPARSSTERSLPRQDFRVLAQQADGARCRTHCLIL
jgi:hypothetical protein